MNPELLHYVQTQLSQGYSMDQIVTLLKHAGWPDQQIEQVIAFVNEGYTRTQMNMQQTYASSAVYGAPQKSKSAKVFKISALLVSIIVFAAIGLFAFNLTDESHQSIFEKTIHNAFQTDTVHQKFTVTNEEESSTIVAAAQSDFSDPTSPRSKIDLAIAFDFSDQATGGQGKATLVYDVIAIDDSVWIRNRLARIELDEETRELYSSLTEGGVAAEDIIISLFGIDELKDWRRFDADDIDLNASDRDLTSSLVVASFGINTVLGETVIGNLGEQARSAADAFLDSGIYAVDYDQAREESIDGTAYLVFDVMLGADRYVTINEEIARLLGLSSRHAALLDPSVYRGERGAVTFWINPNSHLLYKIDSPNTQSNTVIEYLDFGASYDIQPPI